MRLGRTLDGEVAWIDTASPQAILLLGDPGMGKTTLCRYLVRWWLARTDEHVVVSSDRRAEWADLSECSRLSLRDLAARSTPTCLHADQGAGLSVFDGVRNADRELLRLVSGREAMVVVTALSAWESDPTTGVERWGLALQSYSHAAANAGPSLLDPTQARLDWGAGTRALMPDIRGAADFPLHRWHASEISPHSPAAGGR